MDFVDSKGDAARLLPRRIQLLGHSHHIGVVAEEWLLGSYVSPRAFVTLADCERPTNILVLRPE